MICGHGGPLGPHSGLLPTTQNMAPQFSEPFRVTLHVSEEKTNLY